MQDPKEITIAEAEFWNTKPSRPLNQPDRYMCSVKEYQFIDENILEVVATTGELNRVNEILAAEVLDTKHYLDNPVVLWSHDWDNLPIGKTLSIVPKGKRMIHRIEFSPLEYAQQIKQLYKGGFLNAWSYGFIINKFVDEEKDGMPIRRITDAELLELSAVNVPADAGALSGSQAHTFWSLGKAELGNGIRFNKVVPYHEYPHADNDVEWDAVAEEHDAGVDDLKEMAAWYDAEYPNIKASYKLLHHKLDKYMLVKKGLVAAGSAILNTKNGVDIPVADLPAVKEHLEQHYHELDMVAPWQAEEEAAFPRMTRRMAQLVGNIVTATNKSNPTDMAVLQEILLLAAKMKANVGQEDIIEGIEFLCNVLGTDEAKAAWKDFGNLFKDRTGASLADQRVAKGIRSIQAEQRAMKERLNALSGLTG